MFAVCTARTLDLAGFTKFAVRLDPSPPSVQNAPRYRPPPGNLAGKIGFHPGRSPVSGVRFAAWRLDTALAARSTCSLARLDWSISGFV